MKLPEIHQPLFAIKVPSKNKELMFRPFLVKEEKILLMAQESGEEADIIQALTQILSNCCQDELEVDKLAYFDLEYMFLRLRSRSVSNIVEFTYTDPMDSEEYKIRVNLDDVNIETNEKNEAVVWINEEQGLGLRLKFPTVAETQGYKTPGLNQDEVLNKIIEACIEDVFDSEEVHQFDQYTLEEKMKFIDSIPVPVFTKVQEFFDSMPVLRHTIKYKNKAKEQKTITLEGLNDFFTWG